MTEHIHKPCPFTSCGSSDAFDYEDTKKVGFCRSCRAGWRAEMTRDEQIELLAWALCEAHAEDGDHWKQWEDQSIDLYDQIAPLTAVRVKPLVWRDDGTNGYETDHAFGFYEVYPDPMGDMLSRDGVDSGVYPTIEAAKAAAQADYEARILSALDIS